MEANDYVGDEESLKNVVCRTDTDLRLGFPYFNFQSDGRCDGASVPGSESGE
jgi:hypothetical protein